MRPTAAAPSAAPLDVRLMNLAASVAFALVFALVLAAAGWWAVRQPAFAIERIILRGDMTHNSPLALRTSVAPYLTGNFFTINPTHAREAFEQVPWVRLAQVRRQFPNGLSVQLQEHIPQAFWGPPEGTHMVNTLGEVFDSGQSEAELQSQQQSAINPSAASPAAPTSAEAQASPDSDAEADSDSTASGADPVDYASLPRLSGPEGSAPAVLQMLALLRSELQGADIRIRELTWRDRGSWLAVAEGGARLELGGGTPADVQERVQRFVRVLAKVLPQYRRSASAIEYADLRYRDGFALRLRGVGTLSPPAPAPAASPAPAAPARP